MQKKKCIVVDVYSFFSTQATQGMKPTYTKVNLIA